MRVARHRDISGAVRSLSVLLLLCFAASPAAAETARGPVSMVGDQVEVYGLIESLSWEEFDQAGSRLLKENGRLGGIGFAYAVDFSSGLTLRPRLELTGGNVDHDGRTQTGTPVFSDTDHVGARFEIDLGGRLGDRFMVEPFGGIGIRNWWRDVDDSIDINGAYAAGTTEEWSVGYARLGLRGTYRLSDNASVFFEGAAVLPVFSDSRRYLTDAGYDEDPVLRPEARTMYFAEAGFSYSFLKLSAFYETLRFDASDPEIVWNTVTAAAETVQQPRSEGSLFGIRAGASF